MKPEEAHIDQALIKAQASGEWQKHDYRSLLYVGYAAVDASVEATVSAGRFVWKWSVSTKDKALPFSGQASTLDKAISDAQWHIEQVASVEHQVDVFSSVPSSLQTTPPTTPPQSPPLKPGPVRPGQDFLVKHARKGVRTSSHCRGLAGGNRSHHLVCRSCHYSCPCLCTYYLHYRTTCQ